MTVAVVLFALANALHSAGDQSWTYDEPAHLAWSEQLLTSRIVERPSEHFNSKTPVMLPNVVARMALPRASAPEPALRFAARLPSVLWLAAILGTTFVLGRRLFGSLAAHIATTAAALDPNLVAHGSLATTDASYALGTLLTVAAATRFADGPSPWRATKLGLAFGFALTAKFSAILLLPVLLLFPALKRPPRRVWLRWIGGALGAGAVAAATVCAAYLFVDVATPLGGQPWESVPLQKLARQVPWLRLPLPVAFLTGYDASLAAERGDWNVVILGRAYPHGVWFYFAVLWLLKTPLLVLLAELCGLFWFAREHISRASLGAQLLVLTLLLHLGYFSFLFRTQVGYRFVLMCVPLAYLLAAAGLAPLAARRWAPAAAAVVVSVAVLENALYFGNPLSFTNAAVWPKRQAFRLVADSNLDWGQHSGQIGRWLDEHPGLRARFEPPHILPGRNVFSVNEVAGMTDFDGYRFLREHADPGGHLGHTHIWFDVSEGLFDRFLDAERQLTPRPEDAQACPPDLAYRVLAPGSQLNLLPPEPPRSQQGWLVCVAAGRGADLGLRAAHGPLTLGRYRAGTPCDGEQIAEGQEIWYRLAAGVHALCVVGMPDDDAPIPPPVEGWWLLRSREASISLNERSDLDESGPSAGTGQRRRRQGRRGKDRGNP